MPVPSEHRLSRPRVSDDPASAALKAEKMGRKTKGKDVEEKEIEQKIDNELKFK